MIFNTPYIPSSEKYVVLEPSARLIASGEIVPLNDGSGAWVFVSDLKPPTLMDKLNEYRNKL